MMMMTTRAETTTNTAKTRRTSVWLGQLLVIAAVLTSPATARLGGATAARQQRSLVDPTIASAYEDEIVPKPEQPQQPPPEEPKEEEPPKEEILTEEPPKEEAPKEETPKEEILTEEPPNEEPPKEEPPMEEPTKEEPPKEVDPQPAAPPQQQQRQRTEIKVTAGEFVIPNHVVWDEQADNLGFLDAGDILGMQVEVPQSGLYRVEARISNPNSIGSFWIYEADTGNVLNKIQYIAWTKDWNSWATIRLGMFQLEEGTALMNLLIQEGGWNLQHLTFTIVEPKMAVYFDPSPSTETQVISATAFTAASDVTVERPMGGAPNVGGIGNGDFLDYEIPNLTPGATYRIQLGVSSPHSNGKAMLIDRANNRVIATGGIPSTDGWYSWELASLPGTLTVDQDTAFIQLIASTGGFNVLFLVVEQVPDAAPQQEESPKAVAVDEATAGYSNDTDTLTTEALDPASSATPTTNVFMWASNYLDQQGTIVEPSSEGGSNLGSLDKDDWFTYALDLPAAGTYQVSLRIASGWIRGHVDFIQHGGAIDFINADTAEVLGTMDDLPTTEAWQTYTTVTGEIDFPAGPFTLELRVQQGGWNFLWFQIQNLE